MEVYGEETIWCRNFETIKTISKVQRTIDSKHSVWYHFKDNCIVLLTIFHCIAVKLAHVRHQGVQKTKALMRSKVFFIGMDKTIKRWNK